MHAWALPLVPAPGVAWLAYRYRLKLISRTLNEPTRMKARRDVSFMLTPFLSMIAGKFPGTDEAPQQISEGLLSLCLPPDEWLQFLLLGGARKPRHRREIKIFDYLPVRGAPLEQELQAASRLPQF